MKKFLQINNKEQIAIFENMAKNLTGDEIEALTNWGGELYRAGIVNTLAFIGACSLVGFGMGAAIAVVKGKKETDTD